MENFKIRSKADGLELDTLCCMAESPKAVLQLCHGMVEHKERYIPVMEYLAENGVTSFLHDMRGHGKSIKDPEDIGYFYAGDKYACIEDLKTINEHIHETCPDLPVFLLGHSMGSLEVRAYLKKYDSTIDGLIVTGCPSPVSGAAAGSLLVKVLSLIKGQRYRSNFLNKMVLGAYNAPFTGEGPSEHNWLTKDRENVAAYDVDPLCGFTFTTNGFSVLMEMMKTNYTDKGWNCTRPDLPIIFLSGEDDPCRGDRKAFRRAINFLKRAGYNKVDYKLYPGLRHEILKEQSAPYVKEDVLGFIINHLPGKQDSAETQAE